MARSFRAITSESLLGDLALAEFPAIETSEFWIMFEDRDRAHVDGTSEVF